MVVLSALPATQVVAGVAAGLLIGVAAAVMGVAGGELLIPTLVLLYGLDVKVAGRVSLAVSLPRCSSRSPGTAATAASSS